MNLDITLHHSSISARINGKYVETNSIDKLMEHITSEDIDRMDRFTADHLEFNDYSEIEREDHEPIERDNDY